MWSFCHVMQITTAQRKNQNGKKEERKKRSEQQQQTISKCAFTIHTCSRDFRFTFVILLKKVSFVQSYKTMVVVFFLLSSLLSHWELTELNENWAEKGWMKKRKTPIGDLYDNILRLIFTVLTFIILLEIQDEPWTRDLNFFFVFS